MVNFKIQKWLGKILIPHRFDDTSFGIIIILISDAHVGEKSNFQKKTASELNAN
jgi:hypothetical protein